MCQKAIASLLKPSEIENCCLLDFQRPYDKPDLKLQDAIPLQGVKAKA